MYSRDRSDPGNGKWMTVDGRKRDNYKIGVLRREEGREAIRTVSRGTVLQKEERVTSVETEERRENRCQLTSIYTTGHEKMTDFQF